MVEKALEKKVALVTGGSRGIGAAIVRRLAAEGATVAFTYAVSAKAAKALVKEIAGGGGRARAYLADNARPAGLPRLVKKVVADLGGLDILVNNAGVFLSGKIGEIRSSDYERLMRINVDAVFALTNAAVRVMPAGGRIINISSVLGERASGPDMGVYNASKFAVTGFSRSWAKDLGARGILVNAVQPGPIDTDLNPESGENANHMRAMTALGRYGRPEEVAAAVAFLAGPGATYITGATLNVDGGWNA
jgi:NAD(P)-dependent dehydrogenase (short-subunit alcohol dehydrogenase family)